MASWLEQIVLKLRSEFSDLPSIADVMRITLRLLLAAILGGLLGYEREQKGKSAGIRTQC